MDNVRKPLRSILAEKTVLRILFSWMEHECIVTKRYFKTVLNGSFVDERTLVDQSSLLEKISYKNISSSPRDMYLHKKGVVVSGWCVQTRTFMPEIPLGWWAD
ncbi:MAG: hypothetical protein AAF220_13555 [Pseudomonadota bacterium]